MLNKVRPNFNKYIISFLILTITLFGSLGFFIEKSLVDNWTNYYVIFISALGIICLFLNNLEEYSLKKIRKIPLVLASLAIIWMCVGLCFGIHFGLENVKGLVNYTCLLGLGYSIMNINLSTKDKEFIINSILISFFVCFCLGVFQYFSEINLIKYSNDLYPGILGRINSTFYIATIFDKYIVLIEIILIYLMVKNPKIWKYRLLFVMSGIGLTLTFSRSGELIYLFMAFIFFLIAIFKKQFVNVITIITTILLMFLIPGASLSFQSGLDYVYDTLSIPSYLQFDITFIDDFYSLMAEKKEVVNSSTDDPNSNVVSPPTAVPENLSLSFRNRYQKVGLQLIKDYPIFGIGVGNYSYLYNNQSFANYMSDTSALNGLQIVMYPHNSYIQNAAEIGLIGIILIYASLIIYIFYSGFKVDRLKCFIVFLLFIALLISGYTEAVLNSKQYIFIFIILLGVLCSKNSALEETVIKDCTTKGRQSVEKIYKRK